MNVAAVNAMTASIRHALAGVMVLTATAGALDLDLRGYVKNYPSLAWDGGERDWLNTTRARAKLRWYATSAFTFAVEYDVAATIGSPLDDPAFRQALASGGAHRELVDLAAVVVDDEDLFAAHALDRLYVEYYSPIAVVTVGKQRVAWGVSNYFRPVDLFAPFAPSAVDKEERAGIDAVRVSVPWGMLSNIEAIYSPRKGFDDERIGARLRTNVREWDVGTIVGRFEGGEAAGASLSGAVFGAGIKAEALVVRDGYRKSASMLCYPESALCPGYVVLRGDYVRATLGAYYGFLWRNLTVGGEAYYDGSEEPDILYYDLIGLATGRRVTLARRYVAASASALAHPLVTLSAAGIVNLDDHSWFLNPQAAWSVSDGTDITVGVQLFFAGESPYIGNNLSEFGSTPNHAYAIVAWYF